MRFATALLSLALGLLNLLPLSAKADIVGFSGSQCDGDEGLNVPCDNSCHAFGGRHSIRVLAGGTHCVTFFRNAGCSSNVGTIESSGGGACNNVNTGTDVQSFRCGPNSACPS